MYDCHLFSPNPFSHTKETQRLVLNVQSGRIRIFKNSSCCGHRINFLSLTHTRTRTTCMRTHFHSHTRTHTLVCSPARCCTHAPWCLSSGLLWYCCMKKAVLASMRCLASTRRSCIAARRASASSRVCGADSGSFCVYSFCDTVLWEMTRRGQYDKPGRTNGLLAILWAHMANVSM